MYPGIMVVLRCSYLGKDHPMSTDQYRKQTSTTSESQKYALMARVMERRQVDLSTKPDKNCPDPGDRGEKRDGIPEWFAD